MTVPERARVLRDIADAIDARSADIAAAEAFGTGLPVTQANQLSERGRDVFRQAARRS